LTSEVRFDESAGESVFVDPVAQLAWKPQQRRVLGICFCAIYTSVMPSNFCNES